MREEELLGGGGQNPELSFKRDSVEILTRSPYADITEAMNPSGVQSLQIHTWETSVFWWYLKPWWDHQRTWSRRGPGWSFRNPNNWWAGKGRDWPKHNYGGAIEEEGGKVEECRMEPAHVRTPVAGAPSCEGSGRSGQRIEHWILLHGGDGWPRQ